MGIAYETPRQASTDAGHEQQNQEFKQRHGQLTSTGREQWTSPASPQSGFRMGAACSTTESDSWGPAPSVQVACRAVSAGTPGLDARPNGPHNADSHAEP